MQTLNAKIILQLHEKINYCFDEFSTCFIYNTIKTHTSLSFVKWYPACSLINIFMLFPFQNNLKHMFAL